MPWSDAEVRKEYHRKYYAENKQKWRDARSVWDSQRKKQHAKYMRNYALKREYGITADDYQRMFAKQKGKCAICDKEPRKGSNLHVDHCHQSGRVRKLLCVRCNMALGVYETHKERFAAYLVSIQES